MRFPYWTFFLKDNVKYMKLSKNFMTSFVLVELHIRTTGGLLYRSFPISMYGSPVTCSLSNLPKKPKCIYCPGSVKISSLIFAIDGNWFFKFLPELKHAVHVLQLFWMSFFILDHQTTLLSASFFVELGYPKCSESTTVPFCSSGIRILSPAIHKLNLLV